MTRMTSSRSDEVRSGHRRQSVCGLSDGRILIMCTRACESVRLSIEAATPVAPHLTSVPVRALHSVPGRHVQPLGNLPLLSHDAQSHVDFEAGTRAVFSPRRTLAATG